MLCGMWLSTWVARKTARPRGFFAALPPKGILLEKKNQNFEDGQRDHEYNQRPENAHGGLEVANPHICC